MTSRHSLWLITLVLFSVVAAACGTPDPNLASPAPDESSRTGADPFGRILFVSERHVSLWDGSVHTLIDEVDGASPTWAPAGDRFAYVEMHDGWSDVIIAGADGATIKRLTTNEPDATLYSQEYACQAYWALDPVWSPVGEQLIWVSDRGTGSSSCENRFSDPLALWYSENLGGDQTIFSYLLPAAVSVNEPQENPTLSSDGEQVAFTARVGVESPRNTEIWVLNLDDARLTTLVSSADGAFDPAWSPTSPNIAYVQRTGTASDIWIAPADGGDPYQLTNVGSVVSPEWSPDGQFLAFFRERDSAFEAWYVEVKDDNGTLSASEPKKLFDAPAIDAPSGMSWTR
ncbi:MAG TPA: hypothetical protein PKA95_09005 [Thermomicrobiales bacterium]|nr:hypothetical protein [Thermomicrobiales bacterium]